jgi:plasmid maintenance system antidote protein VapI
MSSQDTLNSAIDEEERAKALQREIEKEKARINILQRQLESTTQDMVARLQSNIDESTSIIASLQQKYDMHMKDAERLRQQAADEYRAELATQKGKGKKESMAKKAAMSFIRDQLM